MKVIALAVFVALIATVLAGSIGGTNRRFRPSTGSVNQAIEFPCRFDCLQLVTKSNGRPLFESCRNSVIAYAGDFFGSRKNNGFSIDYQCFTPSTYQTLFASRGKLAALINVCQDNAHRCRKANNQSFNTAAGNNNQYSNLPNIATLAVTTTSKYYQWYSQFVNMVVVNNVVRCPTNFRAVTRTGRNRCNCDLFQVPDLFEDIASPRMPTANSDAFKTVADVPTPVNPYTSYVNGFLGNYTAINPFPNVAGNSRLLIQQARLIIPRIRTPINLGCIDDDVDIISECDDDNDD